MSMLSSRVVFATAIVALAGSSLVSAQRSTADYSACYSSITVSPNSFEVADSESASQRGRAFLNRIYCLLQTSKSDSLTSIHVR